MVRAIFMHGIAGSGKSELAHRLAKFIPRCCILSKDGFRTIDGTYVFDRKNEGKVWTIFCWFLHKVLEGEDNETIILDNTHLDEQCIDVLLQYVIRHYGEYVFITIPPDVSLLKHAQRNKHGVSFSEMIKQDELYRISRVRMKLDFQLKNAIEVKNVALLTDEEVKQIIESMRFESGMFWPSFSFSYDFPSFSSVS